MSARALRKREIGGEKMAEAGKLKKVKMSKGAKKSDSKSASVEVRTTMEFLENLPSYNKDNFSNFQPDISRKPALIKSKLNDPVKDHPFEQVIITEKSTIPLDLLQNQYDKKRAEMRFDGATAGPSGTSSVPRKKSRI